MIGRFGTTGGGERRALLWCAAGDVDDYTGERSL